MTIILKTATAKATSDMKRFAKYFGLKKFPNIYVVSYSTLNKITNDNSVGGFYDVRSQSIILTNSKHKDFLQIAILEELTHYIDNLYARQLYGSSKEKTFDKTIEGFKKIYHSSDDSQLSFASEILNNSFSKLIKYLSKDRTEIISLKTTEQYEKFEGRQIDLSNNHAIVNGENRDAELFAGVIRWAVNKEINNISFLKDKEYLREQLDNIYTVIREIK